MVTSGARFAPKQALRIEETHTSGTNTKNSSSYKPEEKPRTKSRFFRL